jgi:hypothetical protein
MTTKITFVKEKDVVYLAFSLEERETTNEDGKHTTTPSFLWWIVEGKYEESSKTQSTPTLRRSSKPNQPEQEEKEQEVCIKKDIPCLLLLQEERP